MTVRSDVNFVSFLLEAINFVLFFVLWQDVEQATRIPWAGFWTRAAWAVFPCEEE